MLPESLARLQQDRAGVFSMRFSSLKHKNDLQYLVRGLIWIR